MGSLRQNYCTDLMGRSEDQRHVRVQHPSAAVSGLHDVVEQAGRQFDRELAADTDQASHPAAERYSPLRPRCRGAWGRSCRFRPSAAPTSVRASGAAGRPPSSSIRAAGSSPARSPTRSGSFVLNPDVMICLHHNSLILRVNFSDQILWLPLNDRHRDRGKIGFVGSIFRSPPRNRSAVRADSPWSEKRASPPEASSQPPALRHRSRCDNAPRPATVTRSVSNSSNLWLSARLSYASSHGIGARGLFDTSPFPERGLL